jgi:DNA-directed DNA polymerase III PolC
VEFLEAAEDLQDPHSTVGSSRSELSEPRPIVGAEISDPSGRPGRAICLVQSQAGWRSLCRLLSARQLGCDPGDPRAQSNAPDTDPTGPEDFDLIDALREWNEGLILLVDHPRLLLGLMGRLPARQVLAAVSPAALARRSPRAQWSTRNTHAAPDADRQLAAERTRLLTAEPEAVPLDPDKTPPPARAFDADELLDAARATGFAAVAVPDVYHAAPLGRADHELRAAIRHNSLLCDLPEEWTAPTPSHLPAHAELCALFDGVPDVPGPWPIDADRDAGSRPDDPNGPDGARPTPPTTEPALVARTRAIADACHYTPTLGQAHFPSVELEHGESPYSELCSHAFDGARERYRPLRPEVIRRLDHELSTIEQLGFAPYFLLCERIASWATSAQIPCVGRGSAADSLVAYCLGLTEADPFRYGLIFERFLNPERRDRPDIDLDFCWRRRDEVIEHVYELFGHERTAMIATLNCFGLRAAFREAALAEGIPPPEVNRWSRRLPYAFFEADPEAAEGDAPQNPIAHALSTVPEARDFPHDDPRWQRVLARAATLVGAPRHFGLHPGGVVVSPGPITDFVPCRRAAKGVITAAFDKDAVEAIGLVKMDLLGNRALTVLADCLATLAAEGLTPDLSDLDENDPATVALLSEGRTIGCFQIESPGMRHLLQQIGRVEGKDVRGRHLSAMDTVIQAIALIRPGPSGSGMKDAYVRRANEREDPTPPHPRLTELLWDTHGVMLYQEDIMQAASILAGMSLAEADLLRRALAKRDETKTRAAAHRFLTGCEAEGISRSDANRVWELLANFAAFGFCKAHAVTYGRIAYRCAWLKAHHPAAFLHAFLESHTGYYAPRVYLEEARRLGIGILGPDCNRSSSGYTLERRPAPAIRLGLSLIKGQSTETIERLLASRAESGAYCSLPDLLARTSARTDEVEALIQSGALDSFDRTRPELLWRLHLLRKPQPALSRRAQAAARDLTGTTLDPGAFAACRETPTQREDSQVAAARASTRGWGGGLGLGAVDLAPGETASLFTDPPTPALALPGLPDFSPPERAALEHELLGLCLAEHPTRAFGCPADERMAQAPPNPCPCADLPRRVGGRVTLRGWPAATRRVRTSDGRWMRFLTLEDVSGLAEVVVFADVYERDGQRLTEFGTLCITGTIQDQMGAITLHADVIH